MNQYWEHFCQIANDYGLDRRYSYICTLPGIYPLDFIMKYDGQKHKIYCANQIIYVNDVRGNYICCRGQEVLKPKQARARIAELVEKYKEIQMQKKHESIEKDFQ